jgi:hypothetical protein
MHITVFILDYQRFPNIASRILPQLLSEPLVNQIVICHGSYFYEHIRHPLFPRLSPNEIRQFDVSGTQILRIQDTLNPTYQCFRRWIWVEKLYEKGYLQNSLLLTHDDDFIFQNGEVQRIVALKDKGICICGSGGRFYHPYTLQSANGPCPIAVGQSMLLSVQNILKVCQDVRTLGIPSTVLYEDDIVVSLLLGQGKNLHFGVHLAKTMLPSPKSRWHRWNHLTLRNKTAECVLRYLQGALSLTNSPLHSHSLETTLGTFETSSTNQPPPSPP